MTARAGRTMKLTAAHVARVHRDIADPGWNGAPGARPATEADYAATIDRIMAGAPPGGDVWVFAYGSLIWNPTFDFVEKRKAVAHGWHRAFCLGWDRRFRGNADRPGLMLALDRGGMCRGVVYRLAADRLIADLDTLLHREMSTSPSPFPARWIGVATEAGALRAITFAINRAGGRYVSGLTDDQIADALAVAVGFRGSMAEYLRSTVEHLKSLGIHDRHLWRMQELVAERIDAAAARETA